ncbi:FFLEELY motif protein [Aquabacterium sp.]|uniref:FFLEELY motif protein n=1 Tax=Aquabacterium sp. TaxID=1872578 RepID=UPI00378335CA
MGASASEILDQLQIVDRLRAERVADAGLAERVFALKDYQARRFARTYADLLQDARYQGAARFFLAELYGPQEFAARDAQFARVVPALVRLFPQEIIETVAALATLHALSESLDSQMARHLPSAALEASTYARAWQATGRPDARRKQIGLTVEIGHALDHYTRRRMLRTTLHMMRRPAQAAGLSDLQRFLETGFDTFGAMSGAGWFLEIVQQREQALADALFAADPLALPQVGTGNCDGGPLGQLP